ncbi:hypothetical protein SAMN02745194_04670 [Roseomonas rosea]|uniref:Uncharacterized protein n=1 Tax=Muricoccus roseus TaxID=198092 RepID=A0A1M6RG72_9PROT|nr:hypothetical protein [Roseomonas rosea]SHK31378.1 hypothetical protein SAMN02745194_04670 [Roseomonas rosea]
MIFDGEMYALVMTDESPPPGEAPAPRPLPWELHPSLTEERLTAAARLLARGRADAIAFADPWAGDDAWSIGCRAYAFSKHQLARAAEGGRYFWLGVLDETHHFVFLIEGVPVRFYRGEAEDPSRRTLRQQENEAEQLALALGSDGTEGLMFRFAVETEPDGAVKRIVFLALRGEAGRTECFWPVPLEDGSEGPRNSGGFLQLPLSAGGKAAVRPAQPRKRAGPKGVSQEPGLLEGA